VIEGPWLDAVFSDALDRTSDGVLVVKCHVIPGYRIVPWPEGYTLGVMDGDGAPQRVTYTQIPDAEFPGRLGERVGFSLAWGVDGVRRPGWRARRAMPRTRQVYFTLWSTSGEPLAPVPVFGRAKRNGGVIMLDGLFESGVKTVTNIHGRRITNVQARGAFLEVK